MVFSYSCSLYLPLVLSGLFWHKEPKEIPNFFLATTKKLLNESNNSSKRIIQMWNVFQHYISILSNPVTCHLPFHCEGVQKLLR